MMMAATVQTPGCERDNGDGRDAPVLTRISFCFSATGLTGACLAGDEQDRLGLEAWSFTGPSPRWRLLPLTQPVTIGDQLLPLDGDRILLCRNGAGTHQLTLIDQHEDTVREQVLAVVGEPGFRVLPGGGSGGLAVAIAFDGACSTISRVCAGSPHLVRLARVPGLLGGGVWLDNAETLLGVDRAEDGGPAKAGVIDFRDGSWTPMLRVSQESNDRLLLGSPRSKLLLVSTDAPGQERLGWARLGGPEPVRFPETLQAAQPLTLDPQGQRALLQFDEGVRSRLAICTPAADRMAPVEIPPGCVRGTAHWGGKRLRFPFSSPSRPPCVATVDLDGAAGCSLAGHVSHGAPRWVGAHIEQLEGAAGPVEAVVYGGEGWRASSRLLLVLHGGPVDAWRFEFEPRFQRLAAAGVAVVAPNQRGSSGYGAAHTLAIRGAWGGPDLDDILHIARGIAAERRALGAGQLMLCGSSYGAFLALLAASCDPDLWSHCVVFAPFLSGRRLYGEATPAVRGLLEQMGGLQELDDEFGPRDVLRLCHALRAKLLVVHGDRDEVIPVGQSRALRERLLALGKCEGVDFEYVEVPGGRHALGTGGAIHAPHEWLVRFLLEGTVRGGEQRQQMWANPIPGSR